ncbi:MAG: hydrogenase nickel incorporation protein HypB [Spirochaetota bacterium]
MAEKIAVMRDVRAENNAIAERIRSEHTARGVFIIDVLGAPGVGKTSVIREIAKRMTRTVTVIEGDIEGNIDTVALNALSIDAFQINTHGGCHLDAKMMEKAFRDHPVKDDSIVFIENVGNLVCPAGWFIGEHMKLLIVSSADGSDKPYKYPRAFERAAGVVVNKSDLLPYVDFDREYFMNGVLALNKDAVVFEVTAKTGVDLDFLAAWVAKKAK